MQFPTIASFTMRRRYIPPEQMDVLPMITEVRPIWFEGMVDPKTFVKNEVVLITGDGHTLLDDLKRFDEMDVPHDLYCVNHSVKAVKRLVNHWTAIDSEEAMWLAENLPNEAVPEGHRMVRHVIGICPVGYDYFWEIGKASSDDPKSLMLWCGSTAYFAVLSAIWMGYQKIILAGVPLDRGPHWYDPPDDLRSPKWVGEVYTTWMDFARMAEAKKTRSLSGYSAFILGEPTEEWLNGHGK